MIRSHIGSSRSYPGRSVFHAVWNHFQWNYRWGSGTQTSRHRQGMSRPVCETWSCSSMSTVPWGRTTLTVWYNSRMSLCRLRKYLILLGLTFGFGVKMGNIGTKKRKILVWPSQQSDLYRQKMKKVLDKWVKVWYIIYGALQLSKFNIFILNNSEVSMRNEKQDFQR